MAAAAAVLLIVLVVQAKQRGRMSYCRNNLRQLGVLATVNWQAIDPARTGRNFWQAVREAQYRTVKGEWKAISPDPFVCPVLAKTGSRATDPAAIDYRGPKSVPEEIRAWPKGAGLGADRAGNHASGGHLLFVDMSVENMEEGDARWSAAARGLSD